MHLAAPWNTIDKSENPGEQHGSADDMSVTADENLGSANDMSGRTIGSLGAPTRRL
jgi:hypothetical protein